ncbi:MAG: anti-sigma factor, partial [Mesorhizobium sp.]
MSAAEKMSRRDEMETLLPFYLNGSLEGSDLEAVEEWLASDPAALAA